MVLSASHRAVEAAAKSREFAGKLQTERDGRLAAEAQLSQLRAALVQGVAGPSADVSLYQHAPLLDLDGGGMDDDDSKTDAEAEEDAAAASRVMGSLDHDAALRAARLHNLELSRRLESVAKREEALAEEARSASDAKARAMSFAAKLRAASSRASRAEAAAEAAEERVDALTQHITKLMTHLEHEAGGKAKLHDKLRHAEAVIGRLKARNGRMAQANQERDRLVLDLKEGAKILEDQLRLMDQKYVELRGKLDWLRARADKEVRKARKQAEVVERAWLELQASGVIPISRKPPKMPASRLQVGDPPGMPGADVKPLADSSAAAGAASSPGAGSSTPSLPSISGGRPAAGAAAPRRAGTAAVGRL
ncbi:hypothetical protein FNF27_03950 [Cafeteria roenbergensis]|uniref:Uncharacterized protein n=1 Tax=Cafeteria roenbergensis TaxID=33653 RepID=A0A5A8E9V9_CAFRO|nr:hypothetical protein FNF28_06175 [Cafeteria roenbergensis]KAA0163820.1 hypothetical protein FNF31_02675 [Cafeteria roenbergensis]KAA0174575.1 hypothetical protein FNF27_03950 [Cafeteria roenbergensis]